MDYFKNNFKQKKYKIMIINYGKKILLRVKKTEKIITI
jgi:hypothetical protein